MATPTTTPTRTYTGRLADPEFRKERARLANAATRSPDNMIRRLSGVELTDDQAARLAELLARHTWGASS